MKKNIFTKFFAVVASAVMAIGLIGVTPAQAASDSVYVIGTNGNWDLNAAPTLTSTDGVTYTGDIDFSSSDNISIILDINAADAWLGTNTGNITSVNGDEAAVYTTSEGDWARDAFWFLGDNEAGTYTVTWNKNTGALTASLKVVSTTVWSYEYYVAGEATLEAENWSNSDANSYASLGKMTADGTTYTYTADTTASFDGSAGYNIIKIGTPDDGSDKTIEWIKDGSNAFSCNYSGEGTLTITFDSEAGTSSASFVSTAGEVIPPAENTPAGDTSSTDTPVTDQAPATGNNTHIIIFAAIAMVAVVSIVIVSKKKTR